MAIRKHRENVPSILSYFVDLRIVLDVSAIS